MQWQNTVVVCSLACYPLLPASPPPTIVHGQDPLTMGEQEVEGIVSQTMQCGKLPKRH